MAVRSKALSKRRRPSPMGRRSSAARGHTWERTRATIGIFLFMAAFAWLWIIGGGYTADLFAAWRGWTQEQGWAAHLIISAVETLPAFVIPFLPKPARATARLVLLALSLPFGLLDVFSNTLGIQRDLLGDQFTLSMNILATVLGSTVAHAPERAFVYLLGLLWYVWKGQRE